MQLRKASISLRLGMKDRLPAYIGDTLKEICKETARMNTRNRLSEEIWPLKRWPWDTSVGPWFGMAWKGRHTIQAEIPDCLPSSVAWRDFTKRMRPVGISASKGLMTVWDSSHLGAGQDCHFPIHYFDHSEVS